MFTIEQIKAAHAKVKSGTDFPNYIKDLLNLGVTFYETYVVDGHTVYFGSDNYNTSTSDVYASLTIADTSNIAAFKADLKAHQEGKTDYMTFCNDCAKSGVEKWAVCMDKMTCTYYDISGNEMLTEVIPQ
jgi:uncharacterized protein YbcV (DUF1398 family)